MKTPNPYAEALRRLEQRLALAELPRALRLIARLRGVLRAAGLVISLARPLHTHGPEALNEDMRHQLDEIEAALAYDGREPPQLRVGIGEEGVE